MKVSIVPIGNSKGIRIPKAVLEQCHIEKEAILDVKRKCIIIKSVRKEPRKDWEHFFKEMKGKNDDELLISDTIELNMEGWEW